MVDGEKLVSEADKWRETRSRSAERLGTVARALAISLPSCR
jgi:hypothetical protein